MKSREGSHIDDFTALAIMVKSKRVKTASRKKNANTEKPSEDLNQVLDSSDDDAPEEVTFGDSKNEALRSLKLALDSAKRWLTQLAYSAYDTTLFKRTATLLMMLNVKRSQNVLQLKS